MVEFAGYPPKQESGYNGLSDAEREKLNELRRAKDRVELPPIDGKEIRDGSRQTPDDRGYSGEKIILPSRKKSETLNNERLLSPEHEDVLREKAEYISKYIKAANGYVDTGIFRLPKTKYDSEPRYPGYKEEENKNFVEKGADVLFGATGEVLKVTIGTVTNVIFGGLSKIAGGINSGLGGDAVTITGGPVNEDGYTNQVGRSYEERNSRHYRNDRHSSRSGRHHDRDDHRHKSGHKGIFSWSVDYGDDHYGRGNSRQSSSSKVNAVANNYLPKLQKNYIAALQCLEEGYQTGNVRMIERGEGLFNKVHNDITKMKSKIGVVTNDYNPFIDRGF